jgi:tRNA-specific 2-thiouridylase
LTKNGSHLQINSANVFRPYEGYNVLRNRIKVAIGLSGGVDSSVAAALLRKKGYDLVGITMETFNGSIAEKDTFNHACYGPGEREDVESAASICKKLAIPFFAIDLRKEFRNHVIDYFKSEYLAGRTPNPCVVCNKRVKFGFLIDKAKGAGIDFKYFATGHYARIVKSGDRFFLKTAVDPSKDQTYFLYRLTSRQLSQTRFPLGAYTKQQVREMAHALGLETANRRESQDFIDGGDYAVLFKNEELKRGDIVDEKGSVLGKHRGIIHYTIGQRRGLGIASKRPLYVVKIDAEKNRIIVSDKKCLFSKGLIATHLNLITFDKFDRPQKLKTKIRLNQRAVEATVFPTDNEKLKIIFDQPQMAVTPGQSVVLYSGTTVLGGGIIGQAL